MVPTIKDSRGKESTTLSFVTVAYSVLVVKFALAGLSVPLFGTFPAMGGGEFGMAVAGVLAIWLGREWTEKRSSA